MSYHILIVLAILVSSLIALKMKKITFPVPEKKSRNAAIFLLSIAVMSAAPAFLKWINAAT
ncbi:hypothetical protein [Massilia violaceinigra]|uniref:hypothetical protein n=1 Tax=Massilia violaceinigra TaxID=2045208 RepID=UPI0012FE3F0E|nr:hypothetical protein [Massilia violaceinigra]